ncbi:MAG: 16S rRNA (cytidine(1402)-2'-O)-methyltransferase [Elusimicrobiota bacterium]
MLYIVATPIGNLEDLSPRALRILKEVKVVYAEDTRRTLKLLTHFGVRVRVERYKDRDPRGLGRILARLRAGEDVALASDSGMPVLSDPGLDLVSAARKEGLKVCVLPGPFAGAAAVAGSGLPGDSFVFLGFLPRSRGKQRKAIEAAAALGKSIVIYESPFRVKALLALAEEKLGPDAQSAVARELSKLHEEWLTGSVSEVRRKLDEKDTRGEYVVVLHPDSRRPNPRRPEGGATP